MSKALKKLIDINRLREFKNKLVGTGSAYVQTGAVDQTIAGTKTFSKPIVGSVTGSSGSCTGNAATATKLAAARTINGTAFNGTANITTANWGTARNISITDGTNTSSVVSVNGSANVSLKLPATIKAAFVGNITGNVTGNCSGSSGSCTGNAATATTATTAKACTGNAATATKATQDSAGQQIDTTYIKGLAVSGRTITYTKGDGSTGTITTQDTNTWTAFKGATSSANGTAGYVPAPTKGNQAKFFKADGTWATPPNTTYASMSASEAATGTATAARTISAKVLHDKINSNLSAYATKTELNNGLATKANNSEVVHKSGNETIVGTKTFNDNVHASGFHSTANNAFMAQYGGYTLLLRNDGRDTYLLMSDKDAAPGTFNSARPLRINNSTGVCNINGNASTATTATTAKACTGNAATATKATQDSDGNKITTTYSKNGHTHDNRYYTETEVNNLLNGKANTSHTHNSVLTSDNNHTISFDWGSQVPGFVGLTVDATKQGGIVTTARLRAQWYAAYPDGAEAHNAMWGGRDITAAFNNGTVSANIKNGTFKDIFPGDYITKQVTIPRTFADDRVTVLFDGGTYTVNWVIADCDYWINKGNTATTAHHVAIVPQVPIFKARMNSTNTTADGYAGSEMCRNIILACTRGIVNAFGSDHIPEFRDGITNSVDTSHVSSGIPQWTGTPGWWGVWASAWCDLMSEKMVYGAPICAAGAMDNSMATRQMSAFRLSQRLINYNRQAWWLRDVVSSVRFASSDVDGSANATSASSQLGVRPFALLK